MRLFIAIPVPDSVKDHLVSIQKDLCGFPLRFVKREQMHITIDFLGEIPDDKVEKILTELGKVRFETFNIRLTNPGTFPSKEKIRVIWVGMEKDEKFIGLQRDIRKIFNHRGKLMPHLTIARAKDVLKDNRLVSTLENFRTTTKEFSVDRFILYRSDAGPEGHVHSVVREFS